MGSIIFAGVGGTFADLGGGIGDGVGNDSGYAAENGPSTFVKKLHLEWPYGPTFYHRGPGVEGLGTNTIIVQKVVSDVMQQRGEMDDCKGVVLCGHSRGASAVIVAARRLMLQGVGVDCLILMDPVNCTPWPESHLIPSNVKYVIKPMRSLLTLSRPLWGNSGAVWNPITTSCDWEHFFGTHAAIGGQVWTEDSLRGGYIYEPPELVTTRVKLDDDVKARNQVWNYIYPKLTRICNALVGGGAGTEKPVTGQPVGGGIPLQTQEYIVVSGDSLSLISGKYWKDVLLWPILYKANKQKVPNPNKIFPGQSLTIPSIAGYSQAELEKERQEGRNWRSYQ